MGDFCEERRNEKEASLQRKVKEAKSCPKNELKLEGVGLLEKVNTAREKVLEGFCAANVVKVVSASEVQLSLHPANELLAGHSACELLKLSES